MDASCVNTNSKYKKKKCEYHVSFSLSLKNNYKVTQQHKTLSQKNAVWNTIRFNPLSLDDLVP